MDVMGRLQRMVNGSSETGGNGEVGPDGFIFRPEDPNADCQRVLSLYLAVLLTDSARYATGNGFIEGGNVHNSPLSREPRFILAVMERMTFLDDRDKVPYSQRLSRSFWSLSSLFPSLFNRKIAFTASNLKRLLEMIHRGMTQGDRYLQGYGGLSAAWPLMPVLRQLQVYGTTQGVSPDLKDLLEQILKALRSSDTYKTSKEDRNAAYKIAEMLGQIQPGFPDVGEPWADAVRADLQSLDEPARAAWTALIEHARNSDQTRPKPKWLKDAEKNLTAAGRDAFAQRVPRWLGEVKSGDPNAVFDRNNEILKGLIWYCGLVDDPAVCRAVANVAEWAFKKIPGVGPRAVKIGNACLYALGEMKGMEPVAQLTRLQLKVMNRTAQSGIEGALTLAALREGMTPDELEELSVPTYGLDEAGRIRETFGAYAAEASVDGMKLSEWRWLTPEGKTQKSVPAKVKAEFAEDLKTLKAVSGDIQKMLPAQRDRIERLHLTERSWPLPRWRDRYMDHPLLMGLTRRLIWSFRTGDRNETGIWRDGQIVDAAGAPLEGLTDETRVTLWHPIGCEEAAVLAWRRYLEEHDVTQPFKQAHREVYILTDAELNTRTYSNRFAAHVIRQHQFKALCDQKGWRYTLQIIYDQYEDPCAVIRLPEWNLSVEFWVDAIDPDSTTDVGMYLYVSTDQVRFCTLNGDPRPLTEVPARIFSEMLRHVDLFVGVASIGNDPNWQDSGEQQNRHIDYWRDYSFGELSASAATRRDVLSRLLPRLKIDGRCTLDGRFLIVRGDLRTYKIHLGSGNILMEPNDQYLCIVADRKGKGEDLFLPFEGDQTLSIILSKAFLLAEDAKITDTTITSQIKRRN